MGRVLDMVQMINAAAEAEVTGRPLSRPRVYSQDEERKLKFYESAARLYCQIHGRNPDQMVDVQVNEQAAIVTKDGNAVFYNAPAWHLVVDELSNFDLKLVCLLMTANDRAQATQDDLALMGKTDLIKH